MGWVTICYLAFQSGFKAISVWNLDMKFGYSESAFPNSYNTSFSKQHREVGPKLLNIKLLLN